MANLFRKRGFTEAKKEQKRIEKRKEEMSSNIWRFFLKDGDEDVPVRFLTEEPILFYEHSVQRNGKWENETCTGDDECALCAEGGKASHKGAWLIVDGREFEYTDRKDNKKKTGSDQIRLYVRGSTDIAKLDRLNTKYGLTSRPYFATKTGTGTSTSYELDRGEEDELTSKELENLLAKLPKKYKEHADPDDMETLYEIVEDCIFGGVIESDSSTDDDEEEEEDIDEGVRSKKSTTSKSPLKKKTGSAPKKPLFRKKK